MCIHRALCSVLEREAALSVAMDAAAGGVPAIAQVPQPAQRLDTHIFTESLAALLLSFREP